MIIFLLINYNFLTKKGDNTNLYRFFKSAYSITFILEVLCGLSLAIYLIFWGILHWLNIIDIRIIILLVIVGAGITCVVLLLGIGFFTRARDKFMAILGKEEEFPSKTTAQKVVLLIWFLMVVCFTAAIFYAMYLFFQYYPVESVTNPIFLPIWKLYVIIVLICVIIICLVLQLFLIILAKYTRRIIEKVLVKK